MSAEGSGYSVKIACAAPSRPSYQQLQKVHGNTVGAELGRGPVRECWIQLQWKGEVEEGGRKEGRDDRGIERMEGEDRVGGGGGGEGDSEVRNVWKKLGP